MVEFVLDLWFFSILSMIERIYMFYGLRFVLFCIMDNLFECFIMVDVVGILCRLFRVIEEV